MRYHKITYPDIENGLGCRVSLWCSGCLCKCSQCHNPETWSFMSGKEFTEESYNELIRHLKLPYIKGLTLTGGNPPDSSEDLCKILERVKKDCPEKDIWMYSGYIIEDLQNNESINKLLNFVDVIVDGPFIYKERDVSLAFRGSRNQRILKKNEEGLFIDCTKEFK